MSESRIEFHAKSAESPEEGRPSPGSHYKEGRPLPGDLQRAGFPDPGAVHRLPAAQRQGGDDHLQPSDWGCESDSANARGDPENASSKDAYAGAFEAEDLIYS